jgi:ubiquinone/menaquinone biosynthesis C-methylase UbiE
MTEGYIMQHEGEAERIRRKTSAVLTRHHLDWVRLKPGESLVDFGCASGEVVREAARVSGTGRVVGVDGDSAMIEFARKDSDRIGLANVEYQLARIGGIGSTGLPADTFDHAWTRFFLEYQKSPRSVVTEMVRVVKPGGRVTLLDIDGNCVWHYPLPPELKRDLDEVIEDLATTGFDPYIGPKLKSYARAAGLERVRESIEPYHRIVGKPDAETADQWRRKMEGMKLNYTRKLFPTKAHLGRFFDEMMDFLLREDTMTWSNLYMVQGIKAATRVEHDRMTDPPMQRL